MNKIHIRSVRTLCCLHTRQEAPRVLQHMMCNDYSTTIDFYPCSSVIQFVTKLLMWSWTIYKLYTFSLFLTFRICWFIDVAQLTPLDKWWASDIIISECVYEFEYCTYHIFSSAFSTILCCKENSLISIAISMNWIPNIVKVIFKYIYK